MEDNLIDKILDEVVFEKQFYEHIADVEEYDVVYIDTNSQEHRFARDELERKAIEVQCERSGIKVLYRVSYGNYALIVCKEGGIKYGIVPENSSDGWCC